MTLGGGKDGVEKTETIGANQIPARRQPESDSPYSASTASSASAKMSASSSVRQSGGRTFSVLP